MAHLTFQIIASRGKYVGWRSTVIIVSSSVVLARTLTIFANCKAYNIDPYKYLCDVFRRIKTTAKDQLVNLVAHKWQPQMAPAIY